MSADVSNRVIGMLMRIKDLRDSPRRMRRLSAELRKVSGYGEPHNSQLPRMVYALEQCADGWDGLLDAIRSMPEVFNINREQDRQLLDYLLDLRRDDEVMAKVIERFDRFFDTVPGIDGWEDAYYRTVGDRIGQELNSVTQAFADIVRHGSSYDTCDFVERLALLTGRTEEFHRLAEAIAADLKVPEEGLADRRDRIATERASARLHLVVRIDHDHREPVKAWTSWRPPPGVVVPESLRRGALRSVRAGEVDNEEQLRRVLAKLVTEVETETRYHAKRPVVELVVRWEEITKPYDQWRLPGREELLGALAPFVIRPLTTDADPSRTLRQRRWSRFATSGLHQIYPVNGVWPDEELGEQWVGMSLPREFVARAHSCGFPMAIWCGAGEDVRTVLNGHVLSSLPDRLHEHRATSPATTLRLMWDDPHWVIVNDTLMWRSA